LQKNRAIHLLSSKTNGTSKKEVKRVYRRHNNISLSLQKAGFQLNAWLWGGIFAQSCDSGFFYQNQKDESFNPVPNEPK
jgi:hypothetical protein